MKFENLCELIEAYTSGGLSYEDSPLIINEEQHIAYVLANENDLNYYNNEEMDDDDYLFYSSFSQLIIEAMSIIGISINSGY